MHSEGKMKLKMGNRMKMWFVVQFLCIISTIFVFLFLITTSQNLLGTMPKRPKVSPNPDADNERLCRGSWQTIYQKIHEENLKHSRKYLVYKCPRCGWGSRTRTLLSAFLLAVLSKRAFIIDCPLQEYLTPNFIEWNATIKKQVLSSRTYGNVKWFGDKNFLKNTNFEDFFNHSIEVLNRNHDMFYLHLPNNKWYNLPRWMSNFYLFGCTFNFLFKRSPRLVKLLDGAKKKLTFDKNIILGIHIRRGDFASFNNTGSVNDIRIRKVEDTDHFFDCAQEIDKRIQRKYRTKRVAWFLATDSTEIKEYAVRKYPTKIKQLHGIIQHVGWPSDIKNADAGSISMFLDLFLLAHSDFRLFTYGYHMKSSFGDAVNALSHDERTVGLATYKNDVSSCDIPPILAE